MKEREEGTFGGFEVGGFWLMKKNGSREWCRWVGGVLSVEKELRVVLVCFQSFVECERTV